MRVSALCLSSLLLLPLDAVAQPQVAWESSDECPSEQQGRAELTRLLGKPLSAMRVRLTANVQLRRVSAAQFEAKISLRTGGRSSERTLLDSHCDALAHAAAVIVALAIDPATLAPESTARGHATRPPQRPADAGGRRSSSSSEQTPPEAPSPAPSATAAQSGGDASERDLAPSVQDAVPPTSSALESAYAPTSPAKPSSNKLSLPPNGERAAPALERVSPRSRAGSRALSAYLGGAGGLATGVLPGRVAPLASASLGLLGVGYRLGVRLSYLPFRPATLEEHGGAGGRVALLAVAGEGGLRVRLGRFELPLALGLEAGRFEARGLRVLEPRTQRRPWLCTYVGSGVSFAWMSRFALGVRVEGAVALLRPSFGVRSSSGREYAFHRPERGGARAYLELELRVP